MLVPAELHGALPYFFFESVPCSTYHVCVGASDRRHNAWNSTGSPCTYPTGEASFSVCSASAYVAGDDWAGWTCPRGDNGAGCASSFQTERC